MSEKTSYTPGMHEVLRLAKVEASRLGHRCIAPEHYLLGMLRKGDDLGVQIILNLGADPDPLKEAVEQGLKGLHLASPWLFTPNAEARRVIELASDEAGDLGHDWIGTEHLLLALLREEQTVAAECLRDYGVDYDSARDEALRLTSGEDEAPEPPPAASHLTDWLESEQPEERPHRETNQGPEPPPQPTPAREQAPMEQTPESPDPLAEIRIGVVLAAPGERPAMQPALTLLGRLGIPWRLQITPSWAASSRVPDWTDYCIREGIYVLLVAAGADPALPALIAGACPLPVIAVPLGQAPLAGSPVAPFASVAVGDAEQAAMLAVRIVATLDPSLADAIDQHRQAMLDEIERQNDELTLPEPERPEPAPAAVRQPSPAPLKPAPKKSALSAPAPKKSAPPAPPKPAAPLPPEPAPAEYAEGDEGPVEVRPVSFDRPLTGKPLHAAAPEPPPAAAPATPPPARVLGRRRIDIDAPDVELIEEAVDCLLEGGVIAFPTDTVYGVAVDATNRQAVERLFELKGRPRNKAITLLVDSPRLLAGIACNLTVEMRRLMEAYWPGPLTIIFQKRGGNFAHVSEGETIGVRLPDHSVPLSIMQALARPLACTSANLSGQPEALSADEVDRILGAGLNLILDGGRLPESPPSTVIDVTREPYRILRLGALTHEQLAAIVGDKLEPEG